MHLHSHYLPRPSASSPPDNRAHPMANPGQIPDLEGLHHEIHDMAEQMRIMNENNGRLMQLLTAANPSLLAAPPIPDIERSRHSNRSEIILRISVPNEARRGRSPHRGDHIEARNKSTSQKIRDLDARLDAINTGTNAPFKLPAQLGIYEGKTDQMDHLHSYKSLMSLQGCSDEVMCKVFSATLKGPAKLWFQKLSPGTIDFFGDLSQLFVANFMSCRNRQKNASHLFTVHPKETESLKDFVKRFNQAILEVEDPNNKVIIMAMMEGLRPGPLFDSLSKNVPETLSALQSKTEKYIATEELAEAKRRRRGKDDHKRKEPDTRRINYREETRHKRPDRDPKCSNDRRPRTPPRRSEFILPPLNAPIAQVLSKIKHEEFVKWPGKIKTDPQKRNQNKYYEFYWDHGHNTEDYFQLKEQIADLIKKGYLRKYVVTRPLPNSPERRYGDNRPTGGDIQTIHKGFRSGGCSTSSRKKHARSALRLAKEEIYNLSSSYVGDQTPITFSNDDLRGLHLLHDDALVVSAVIANFNVQRILIDNGSSADILFISAFERMKIGLDKLHPFHTPLIGFEGNTTHPLGWINLPITLGTEPHQITVWQDFIMVDCPSPYNAILGRPTLGGGIKAITSTYHLKLKFSTPTGIGEIKGDQKVARQCFISAMKVETSSNPLKNTGATYQRLVNKMFKEQIGKTMEVYIDDMLVKSFRSSDHIAHLKEAFSIFCRHRMMLNPFKCIFGVSSGKCLGFMVTKRGIEVNLDQIQALIAMSSPRNVRKVQQLIGRVTTLNRFVSTSADNLRSISGLRHLLTVSTTGEDLYVYLSISPTAVSAVLIREKDQVQKPIYYVSKVLMGAEARYPRIEKLAYTLMIAARKLRHYFQAHPIIVLTNQPLKQILQRPDTSGRLLKWSIELSEFHIEYRPRMAIKAQALADFIVESTHEGTPQPETAPLETEISEEPTPKKDLAHWILFVDGFSNQHGCGARTHHTDSIRRADGASAGITPEQGHWRGKLFAKDILADHRTRCGYVYKEMRQVSEVCPRQPPPHTEMVPMSSPWPFAQWGIDILGPLPRAPLQRKFLIVAIDYFTKWIEAQPLAKITEKNTRDFIWKHLVCRFGIPKVIISGNARQFDNDKFKLFCSDLAISHHFSSPGHPQANGQVEVTNRTILRNLKGEVRKVKKRMGGRLAKHTLAYHTTSQIPMGETPYTGFAWHQLFQLFFGFLA
ncbi:hypothetical protein Acr_18g0009320 [Actinidia rufa]|uniref:RNA-directed DNA polymerase n=1 Tax=Actinidia rufa TaxID=165716 RepID=A0A7J0G7R0_9ERIC|nr:hypothetical protein Acr_18g0009320 [Actinidia rufa]